MKRPVNKAVISFSVTALLALLLVSGCSFPVGPVNRSHPFVQYRVTLKDHDLNIVRVRIDLFGSIGKTMRFVSPHGTWDRSPVPIGITALDREGRALSVTEGEGDWIVEHGGKDFSVYYDVVLTVENRYSPDIKTMLSFIDHDRCRLLGGDLFIMPAEAVSEGVVVDTAIFPGMPVCSAWAGTGTRITVPSIGDLPSTVVVSGNYRLFRRWAGQTELVMAIASSWTFHDEELLEVIERIVTSETALFGSSPHERYLFVCDRNPIKGYRGFNLYGVHFTGSIVLLLDTKLDRSQLFDTPMAIVAHEFFHNWNGETLRPRTDEFLWFTEGVTVYYSYKTLLDANIITPEQHRRNRDLIAKRYMENSYLEAVPIGEAVNSDLGDKDLVNLLYDGGFLAAEALDAHITEITRNRIGLIDILRMMYEEAGGTTYIDEEALTAAVRRLSGHDISGFLHEIIHRPAPSALTGTQQSS
ncbi:MAG: hypothetical protein JSV33_14675 [bacterium]|nr:MAG: hypothetical protein JSV33_14675 [bacterium]